MTTQTQLAAMLCKYFPAFNSWFNRLDEPGKHGLMERWAYNLGDTTPEEVNGFVRWLVQGRLEIGEVFHFDRLGKRCRDVVLSVRPREAVKNTLGVEAFQRMDATQLAERPMINDRRREIQRLAGGR